MFLLDVSASKHLNKTTTNFLLALKTCIYLVRGPDKSIGYFEPNSVREP
jgi:hypothetical protein